MNSGYLHFPDIDPVIFSVGPLSLHWYGMMYLVGFVFAMWLAIRRANRPGSGWTKNEVENLLYAGFLGVFLGGRIGYVLFYNMPLFLDNPLYLFKVLPRRAYRRNLRDDFVCAPYQTHLLPGCRFYCATDPVWSGRRPFRQLHQRRIMGPR